MSAARRPAPPRNQLGPQLKRLRRAKDFTLETLSMKSGVSRAMISKIERGESQPTTPVLGRLAEALQVGISTLVGAYPGPKKQAAVQVFRTGEQAGYRDPDTGFERRALSPVAQGRGVDVAMNSLPPRGVSGVFVPHAPLVEEHVVAIAGRLRVRLDEQTYDLAPGDALFFRADVNHQFENLGRGTCRYLIVIDRSRLF